MSYSEIDPVITAWAQRNSLHVYTQYQESEVRSIDIVSKIGERFQLWIDRPFSGLVDIHAWDYRKTKKDWQTPIDKLNDALEEALQTVESWMKKKPA